MVDLEAKRLQRNNWWIWMVLIILILLVWWRVLRDGDQKNTTLPQTDTTNRTNGIPE